MKISDFEGIEIGVPGAAILIDTSLSLAQQLHESFGAGGGLQVDLGTSRFALLAATAASSALLALGAGTCTRAAPPADIGAVTDSEGNLVLRCGHSPPHEWDYDTGAKR